MKLEFTAQRMTLAHVNARSELHGEEREAASDLKFEVTLSNDVLAQLDPQLKASLYKRGEQEDIEPGHLPHLKFPKMAQSMKWDDEMKAAKIAIVVPGEKKATELNEVKVNNISFTPKDGGSVAFSFRVQYKPDEKVLGKLGMLVQTEVEVTLAAVE